MNRPCSGLDLCEEQKPFQTRIGLRYPPHCETDQQRNNFALRQSTILGIWTSQPKTIQRKSFWGNQFLLDLGTVFNLSIRGHLIVDSETAAISQR